MRRFGGAREMCAMHTRNVAEGLAPKYLTIVVALTSTLPSNFRQADISSEQINTLLEATGNTEVAAFYPIIFSNFLSAEKISEMIVSPVAGGGGGGGGGTGLNDERLVV